MPEAPTKTEPVFMSRHTNLRITRFPERGKDEGGPLPGLSYDFGQDSGVQDSEGYEIVIGGTLRVTDELRLRDEHYIDEYAPMLDPERTLNREDRRKHKDGKLDPAEAFLSTEEFLRKRAEKTRGFYEVPVVAPDPADELRQIAELAVARDTDGLVELAAKEKAGWGRRQVLDQIEHVLEMLAEGKT